MSDIGGAGFVVLYRWTLRPGMEDRFVDAWSRITIALRDECGSLGSRLHRGPDGIWYGYAQWPSAEAREHAASRRVEPAARAAMREAIAEDFPEIVLAVAADFLVLPDSGEPTT